MGTDYDFDLLDPVHLAEPYGLFRRLRNTASLVHVPDPDVWVATSYAAVHSVLRDTRRFSSFEGLGAGWSLRAERHGRELEMSFQAGLPGVNVMLGADGADHARLRAIAAPYFTRKAVEACKPFVESKIGGLVDNVIEHGGDCEAVADLIAPVPAATLAHLVGLPPSLCNEMESFASALSGSWDPTSPLALKSQRMRLGRLGWDMIRALRNLLSSPSHVQEGSFVRELADRSNDHHDEMTDYEAISVQVLAIMAGVETTRS